MSNDLVVLKPADLMVQAQDVAGVCAEIVKRTAMTIQGRKYVRVEGWQSIAAAYGCVASSRNVERIAGGVRAVGELRRVADGVVIAVAEGFVGDDEPVWSGGEVKAYGKIKVYTKRPDYAIQAMAQTRAISRVCRSAFAFVVVMIDGNLSTTPAEEMSGLHGEPEREVPPAAEDVSQEVIKADPRQIEAIHTALSKHNVTLADLLSKANITDLKDMPSDDCMGAIQWITKRGAAKAKAAA